MLYPKIATGLGMMVLTIIIHALFMVAGVMGVFTAHKEASQRSKKYRDTMDALMLKIPVIGNIVIQSVYARYSRTLSTTFAAGVPLVDALDSVAGAQWKWRPEWSHQGQGTPLEQPRWQNRLKPRLPTPR